MNNLRAALEELYEFCRGLNDFRVDSKLARKVQAALLTPDTTAAAPQADATCYLRRSEVREILTGQPDENLDITEGILAEIDALDIISAAPQADAERMRRALEPFAKMLKLYDLYEWDIGQAPDKLPVEVTAIRELVEALSCADEGKESEGSTDGRAGRPWPSPKPGALVDEAMASTMRTSPVVGVEPGPSDPPPAQERREGQTAAFQNTDDAGPALVLAAVRHCASSWVGEARLLGNVRAKDIVRAIDALPPPKGEPSQEWDEIALALQRVERECLSLKCCDVGWEIVEHRMTRPRERMVAHGKTPIEALRALRREPGGR